MTHKETAQDIFNAHYMILFDSESDKGEEILVSLLAKKCAIITVQKAIELHPFASQNRANYLNKVLSELKKM